MTQLTSRKWREVHVLKLGLKLVKKKGCGVVSAWLHATSIQDLWDEHIAGTQTKSMFLKASGKIYVPFVEEWCTDCFIWECELT